MTRMMKRVVSLLLLLLSVSCLDAFTLSPLPSRLASIVSGSQILLSSPTDSFVPEDEDDEEVEPGKMRVSEIKSELRMRGVKFDDCFDKESLVERLQEARATGRADPEILNEFNKKKLEENFSGNKVEVTDEDLERMKANDGTLPGGMKPEMLQKLMGNPEIMALLQSPKMQEAMKLMMKSGREELENAIKNDPELQQVVEKLDMVMRGAL